MNNRTCEKNKLVETNIIDGRHNNCFTGNRGINGLEQSLALFNKFQSQAINYKKIKNPEQ